MKQVYKDFKFVNFMLQTVPLFKWLPKYSFRDNFVDDIFVGVVTGLIHISKGTSNINV